MMNLIEKELKEKNNISITENGAIGYKTTEHKLLDLTYNVTNLRHAPEEKIIKMFDEAFFENKEYCVKWLFFARDILKGLGERRIFRICYKRLLDLDVDLFRMNLKNISEYGRWDDIISLIGISDVSDNLIITVINLQLSHDILGMDNKKPISLLGKWLPSENTSSKKTRLTAKKVRKLLKLTSKEYRLLLTNLRNYLDVVEIKMCNNEWDKIDYEHVPSLANLKYRDAFMEHDGIRRAEYLNQVHKGESKMNMKTANPADIVSKYIFNSRYGNEIGDYDESLELAWKNLTDVNIKNTLVVADGSGSMYCDTYDSSILPICVANGLAVYTSEHNNGIYKNKYISFSNTPQFVEFNETSSLHDKLEKASEYNEMANTNIEAVFDLILDVAVKNNLSSNEMVENILIISDMEFDMAQQGWEDNKELTLPLFQSIKEKYNSKGYELPKLIFWNVDSSTGTIPLIENELGVVLVSGYSQNILNMVMSNKFNPYEVLIETLDSERYSKIKV